MDAAADGLSNGETNSSHLPNNIPQPRRSQRRKVRINCGCDIDCGIGAAKKRSMEVADGISNGETTLSSLPNSITPIQQSKNSSFSNRELDFEEITSQLQLTAPPCKHVRQKISKKVDGKKDDSYKTYRTSLRSRAFPRSRGGCNNAANQGKLNTKTLQCYWDNLWNGFPEERRSSFAYVQSLWYILYTNGTAKEKVLSWIKNMNIFSKKYVFVPIVQWGHWNLLIFCNFGENIDSKIRTPCILLLDSLQTGNAEQFEPGIRKFVLDIYKSEGRPEDEQSIYNIPFFIPKVPQQRNGEECGKYVLFYMNLFLESAPENFSVSDGYPYFMDKNWFGSEELECFYKRLDTFSHQLDDW